MAGEKINFINNHRTICPTCEGRTCIVCCSVEDNTECETIACPTCGGKGYLVNRNKFWLKVILLVVGCVILGNVVFFALFNH